MPSVIFTYTKEKEKKYAAYLLKKKEWFDKNNFPIFLPASASNIDQDIAQQRASIIKKSAIAKTNWKKIEKAFFRITEQLNLAKILPKYFCQVSSFGPQGTYSSPDSFRVRLRTIVDTKYASATIGHELLHLVFADLFDSKKLNYAEREGMIDALILETGFIKLFPKYGKQSIGKVNRVLFRSITHI